METSSSAWLATARSKIGFSSSMSQDSAVVPFSTYTFSKSVPGGHNSALTIPGGPCVPLGPIRPCIPWIPCGPSGPTGPCGP